MTERNVAVDLLNTQEGLYQDSPLFCNLKLFTNNKNKKKRSNGSVHIVGFTRKEAEKTYKLLGEVLKK